MFLRILVGQHKQKGFTLIELLIVLSITFMMTSFSIMGFKGSMERKQLDHFFEDFQSDILFSQSYAMSHDCQVLVYIDDQNSKYVIMESGTRKIIQTRGYKDDISIKHVTLTTPILFHSNGNINQAGKLHVYYNDEVYAITFLLGKGRFYVKKL